MFIMTRTGTKRCRETTKGFEVLVQWKDGRTTWVTLKDMKNSYPVFAWWIWHLLEKCNRIIGNLKSKHWVQMHKFGVKTPKSVQEAKAFDREKGNTLWWDAICKEMRNIRPAF